MSEDNKKQNEPDEQKELTSADGKQVPGDAELSADELQQVAGGGTLRPVKRGPIKTMLF
jgi:hypothetical protein